MNYRAEITSSHKTNISAFCGSKRGYLMSLQTLARSGAIVSSAGVVLMVVFVIALLSFPVIKNCGESGRCTYRSTAPGELQLVVQPSFLAVSLITIAAGVLILRFSRWLESRKSENDINH